MLFECGPPYVHLASPDVIHIIHVSVPRSASFLPPPSAMKMTSLCALERASNVLKVASQSLLPDKQFYFLLF